MFAHLGAVTAYARRRGSLDPDAIAAEVMTIAWRRLADVPEDDPRPWLYATARNLLLAEWRKRSTEQRHRHELVSPETSPEVFELDPQLAAALSDLPPVDREAILLIAWEELTPTEAARSLGINPTTFRVRLMRARRRVEARLALTNAPDSKLTMEST